MGMIFGESPAIKHKVGDREWEFWPLSVEGMFYFKNLYGPVGRAFAGMTESKSHDTATVFREAGDVVRDENGKPFIFEGKPIRDVEQSVEAMTPELARFRSSQREKSIDDLVQALSSDENKVNFARIIIDCMRLKKAMPNECPPPEALFQQITLDQMPDIVTGIAKANKGVFGPLTETLGPLLAQVRGEVERRLSENAPAARKNHGETSPTPSSE